MENDSCLLQPQPSGDSKARNRTRCHYWLEQINTSHGTWYALLISKCSLFWVAVHKNHQKKFAFSWQGQQYTFMVLLQWSINSPVTFYDLVWRELPWLSVSSIKYPTSCELVIYCIEGIMLIASSGQEVAAWTGRDGVRKNQGLSTSVASSGVQWCGIFRGIHPKAKNTSLCLALPTTKKEAQCWVGLFEFWRQCVPHLAVLLWPIHRVTWEAASFVLGLGQKKALQQVQGAV